MSARYGIDLLTLLNAPLSSTTTSLGPLTIPPAVSRFLRTLSILGYDSSTSEDWVVYNGIIQTGIFQSFGDDASDWPLRIPGLLETGLPFRMFQARAEFDATGSDQIEGSADRWLLQIATQGLSVRLPFDAADFVPESSTRPAYLVAREAGADKETRLNIDTGVLEITSDGDVLVRPNLSMSPDPYHGALIRFRVNPTQFFVYEESVGLRMGEVVLDLSELVSPPEAETAGFGPAFKGAYIQELGVYFPRDTPFIVPKSITLREALIGTSFAGEGIIEFAADSEPTPIPTFIDQDGREVTPDSENVVRLPLFSPGGVIDSRLRVIAVADVRDPWGARREQARWELPDGETFTGSRTELLEVRPGDVIRYTYAPAAGESYEPPAEQSFRFDVAGGIYPEGTVARISLQIQRGTDTSTLENYFDVTHINAPLAAFIPGDGSASDLSMRLLAHNERGDPLGDTVESTWLVNDQPVATGTGSTTRLNLSEYVDTTEVELPADASDEREVEISRSTLRITLNAEGFRRTVIVDVIGDNRMRDVPPIVVHRPRAGSDWADNWTAVEVGVAPPLRVREPGDQQKFHYGYAIAQGRLRPLAGLPEPTTDRALESGGEPPGPRVFDIGDVCSQFRPGYVYELIPGTPDLEVRRDLPRPTQISFFFETGKSGEGDISGTVVLINGQSDVPSPTSVGRMSDAELAALFDGFQGGALEVVGRSSTRWTDDASASTRFDRNRQLGVDRAATVHAIMTRVMGRPGMPAATIRPPREEREDNLNRNSAELRNLQNDDTRLGEYLPFDTVDPLHNTYQRADVFITNLASASDGPVWTQATDEYGVTGARRVLLPCPPRVSPDPIEYDINDSALERLRLSVRWDRDPMPTMMEIMAVLRTSSIDVDAGDTGPQSIDSTDIETEEDLWRLVLGLITDAQTGISRWSLTFDAAGERDGLFSIDLPPALGTLFVFAPLFARLAQAEADDGSEEVNEAGWVTLGVLASASLVAEAAGIIDDVKLIANGVSIDIDTRGGPFSDFEALYVKLDYSVEFRIREPVLLGIESDPDQPVRLRFRNVGFAYHEATKDIRMLFDEEAEGDFSIEDAGTFRQAPDASGALSSLLQVVGARLGQGSVFIELDLKFVIDIGLLEVTQTTIRLVFDDEGFRVQLRGLGVKIEIPNTLVGEGSLVIRDNGFRATLALEVIPAKLYAAGSLDFHDMGDWTAVGVGLLVQFPVGLPLGGSGLAIYGLIGAFGANMRRAVTESGNLVENELQWVGRLLNPVSADSAFAPNRDSWTFGVGAVVGTLPDGGSSFHAKGALALELPGPTVLFGIDVQFISQRRGTDGGNDLNSAIRGLIGINPEAFIIGIRVDLTLGDILRVKIPIDALFPTQPSAADRPSGYLRIGVDGSGGRTGDPVTVELKLSDFVGVNAWLFLMIEERGIVDLGRKYLSSSSSGFPELQGFSIGFGMGISLFVGVREIGTYLEVELLAIAGMGTSPIVIGGFIEARGTLSILWIGFSVSAMLDFLHRQPGPALPPGESDGSEISEPETTFKGRFCAEISFFFFSIKECFEFELGSGDPCAAPAPPPLIPGLGFVDRRGFEMASVKLNEEDGTQIGTPVVWPDTTIVVNLLAEPDLNLASASPFVDTLTSTDHNSLRVGEFDYEFRLDDLRLERFNGTDWEPVAERLDASMWFPTGRPAFGSDGSGAPPDLAGHGAEARSIGLLTWDPIPWSRALVPGAHPGVESDIEEAADNLCEQPESDLRDCAQFENAKPAGRVGRWNVRGENGWADLVASVDTTSPADLARDILKIEEALGADFAPMAPVNFPFPLNTPLGEFEGGLRSGQFQRLAGDVLVVASTLGARLDLVRTQFKGSLLLLASTLDHKFNSDNQPILRSPHEGTIGPREASVTVIDREDTAHLVPGKRIGTFSLGETVNQERYDLWLFETIDSPLGKGDFNSWHVPAAMADIILLQACGSDTKAREEAEERNQNREDATDAINDHVGTDLDPSRFVLDANTRHRVTARWTWTGRRVTDPVGDDDSDRVKCSGDPTTGTVDQVFEFRTAPEFDPATLPAPAPGELPPPPAAENADIEYSTFDVRDLSEYLKRVPSFEEPPIFVDDLIHIEYHVDHIVNLLERYSRTLELAVVRTDTTTEEDPVPFRFQVVGSPDYWEEILFGALAAQPCVTGEPPARGGGELLDANLEPNARYDLLVTGPLASGSEDLDRHLIRRAPFQTSRYANTVELMAAMGWAPTTAPLSYLPEDIVLGSEVSTAIDTRDPADVDFEEGLAGLDLDIEQRDGPYTTVLWRPPLPTPEPEPPTLRDGLGRLGLLDRGRLNVPRLVELLVRRARSRRGWPILPRPVTPIPDRFQPRLPRVPVPLPPATPTPPPRQPSPFVPDFRIPRIPRRPRFPWLPTPVRPGSRYGLTWFHELLVAEGLDEGGSVVEELGARLTTAFRWPILGGIRFAVSLLSELVREILERTPTAPRPRGWRIAGVILQSLEPIERDGRLSIDGMSVGSTALTLRRSNSSRSRLLFLADTAIELVPGDDPLLSLEYEDSRVSGVTDGRLDRTAATVRVEHRIGSRPQSIDWEV